MLENGNKLKVCLCISGGIKWAEKIKNTIEMLKTKYDLYITIHTWQVNDGSIFGANCWSGNHTYYSEPKQLEQYLTDLTDVPEGHLAIKIESFEDKFKEFQIIKDSVESDRSYRPNNDVGIVSMYYSIWQAQKLANEMSIDVNFDWVIRARFDSSCQNINLEDYDNSRLHIPDGNDYTGANDQFAFGNMEMMNLYSALYPNFVKTLESCRRYHPETMLLAYLNNCGQTNVCRPHLHVAINGGT